MEALLGALESTGIAEHLRLSRWSYAAVNAAHIAGFALLVGAIMPLNLRFLGLWRDIPQHMLVRALVPVAATGLGIAVLAGFLLFSVRAREYAGVEVLQAKLVLVTIGTLSALATHARHGFLLASAGEGLLKRAAIISIVCWLGALTCGRLIAFAAD